MKKLTALLSIPLIAAFTACAPKEPIKKNYNTGIASIDIGAFPNAFVKDFDKDGLADAIISNPGYAIFYVKGYEKYLNLGKASTEMTPELRKYATDFIKADNNLRYEAAKIEYESNIQRYDTNDLKKMEKK